jgi:hypothetical protein
MTQKEMVLDAIRELPDDASVRDIADRLGVRGIRVFKRHR